MKIKYLAVSVISMIMVACGSNQSASAASNESLPKLNTIQTYTFAGPYQSSNGYKESALFITNYSLRRNSPDLLYIANGKSGILVNASTAGDDFSLISDMGTISLEDATSHRAFNVQSISGRDNTFKETMAVQVGHTYAVLISKSEIRALYVFRVESVQADGAMKIRYAVKSYSIIETSQEAPGFAWEVPNR